MSRTTLTNSDDQRVYVDEGESCDIVATFIDLTGASIDKASILTLTANLLHVAADATTTTINNRSSQSVLDANGGTISSAGVLTLRLQPEDNPIVGTVAENSIESHYLTLVWTWNDGTLTRTGKQEFEIQVRSLAEAA